MEKENIILKMFELIKYSIPLLEKLPRTQKFVLGDRMEVKMLEIQEQLIAAYYTKNNKSALLHNVNISLEQLRYLIRLVHEMRYISTEKYGVISEKVNEIGKMCGGWIKSLQ